MKAAKRFPAKEEFETIGQSRQIVKRIEDCAVDAREATSSTSEDELPNIASKEDVVCGEHTFMHITKVVRNKLTNSAVQRKALSSTFKAIQQHNSFLDIGKSLKFTLFFSSSSSSPSFFTADYVEQEVISTAGGSWLCIVGKRNLFDSNYEAKMSEYLVFTISHIQVQLLKLSDASSSSTTGSSSVACPPSACTVSLNSNAKAKVKRSTMSTEQRADTLNYIKTALSEYAGSQEGVQYVCPYVTNELAINYASQQWACVAGSPSAYQFTHTVARAVQLHVQFDSLHVQVLQLPAASTSTSIQTPPTPAPSRNLVCPPIPPPVVQPQPVPTVPVRTILSQFEVITSARSQLSANYVQINETRMTGQLQVKVIGIILDAVATENTYDGIARRIRDMAGNAFGNYWASTVGTDTQYWTYFYMSEPFFINLKIDRLRILLYRQIMYRAG